MSFARFFDRVSLAAGRHLPVNRASLDLEPNEARLHEGRRLPPLRCPIRQARMRVPSLPRIRGSTLPAGPPSFDLMPLLVLGPRPCPRRSLCHTAAIADRSSRQQMGSTQRYHQSRGLPAPRGGSRPRGRNDPTAARARRPPVTHPASTTAVVSAAGRSARLHRGGRRPRRSNTLATIESRSRGRGRAGCYAGRAQTGGELGRSAEGYPFAAARTRGES